MTLDISKHINQLLYTHECVIVSGLGAFIIYNKEVVIDEKKNYFTPNKKSISFNSEIKKNDGLLANYISEIENISYEEACVIIAKFSKKILYKINNGESFYFESIGILKSNSSAEIIFQSDEKINFDPAFFGLDSFYFPKINHQRQIIQPQYISGFAILLIFVSIGVFLTKNISINSGHSNTASLNPKMKVIQTNTPNEISGLYKISVSQIDYDLYKISGTNYHLSTKRCFKMGDDIEAQLKIYNEGKSRNRELCFLNELGAEFTDCYQIKNVYNQIPTSSNKLLVLDKKGKMRNAVLVFEETIIDYNILTNKNKPETLNNETEKNDIASRFLEAVKTLSENSKTISEESINNTKPDSKTKEKEKVDVQKKIETPKKTQEEATSTKTKELEEIETPIKNIFVIVGCFSSEKNANNLVSQLKKKGFKDACIAGRSSNRKLFRVSCSKFETTKEANKKLKHLKKEFEGAWLLNRN